MLTKQIRMTYETQKPFATDINAIDIDTIKNKVTLTQNNYVAVRNLSRQTKQDISDIVNQAVVAYLQDLQDDVQDIKDANLICSQIDSGKMKTYSLSQVKKELGL